MMILNIKVDEFLDEMEQWEDEFRKLRKIILDCGLNEEFKWRLPCYTFQKKNIVILQNFKEYAALMFFKGSLLEDPHNVLVQPGKSQAQRQIRFKTVEEIEELELIIKEYIEQAIKIEEAGLNVEFKDTAEYEIPEELEKKFKELPALKTAFDALTPGRQRGYIYYFSKAKQAKTREARIEKYIEKILDGKGLND